MASWIGATDAQRFWQYTVPAARKAIDRGDWTNAMAEYAAQAERSKARLIALDPDSYAYRAEQRHLEGLRRDWKSCRDSLRRDEATLAEADRRRGMAR